jgi:hypothetical protein
MQACAIRLWKCYMKAELGNIALGFGGCIGA